MTEQRDRGVLTGTALGVGALALCCALPAIVGLGALALGLVFGLGGAALVLAFAATCFVRRRRAACSSEPTGDPDQSPLTSQG